VDLVTWLLATRQPDDVAWIEGDTALTVSDLRAAAGAIAASLSDLPAGAVVATAAGDRWACLAGVLGAIQAGCAAWPLRAPDPITLRELGVAALLTPDGATRLGGRARVGAALILETSGSGGAPRRVMLGDRGLRANVDAILGYLPARAGEVVGLLTPLHYSYGLVGQCLTALRGGATIAALTPGPWAARQVEEMARHGVTGLSAVPSTLSRFADLELPPALSWLASAGAPLHGALVDRLHAAAPHAALYNQYGMTEASPRLCATRVDPSTYTPGLVGPPLSGVAVAILGEHGRPLPAGQIGRVVARTPSAMLGYWGDPEATERALTPRGLETGDLGFLNEHGHLHITGRADDLVQVGGERVSLRAVEGALLARDGVQACYAFAPASARFGRHVEAVVVAPGVDTDALRRALAGALAPAALPRTIHARAALPMRPNGKLDRAALDREFSPQESP
jgi:acyl-CoA synthetase (AMP-forming)/AMP-acid ligase II